MTTTQEELQDACQQLTQLVAYRKQVEASRKSATQKLRDQLAALDAPFEAELKELNAVEEPLREYIADGYAHLAQERERLLLSGVECEQITLTKGVSVSPRAKIEVFDTSLLPREWVIKTANMPLVREWMASRSDADEAPETRGVMRTVSYIVTVR